MLAKIFVSNQTISNKKIEEVLHLLKMAPNHPDLLIFDNEKFNLEQAKKIKEFFSFKPHQAKGRIVVIKNVLETSTEAQNALLKTIEELPEIAQLIITTHSETIFLPTILSRCEIIKFNQVENFDQQHSEEILNFVNMTVQEKFYYIEKLKEKEAFLFNLTKYFQVKLYKTHTKDLEQIKQFLNECLEAEKWDKANGNIRGILEYLALITPKV